MGLFINNQTHPNVYKNTQDLQEPNQSYSKKDFVTELMKEQQLVTMALRNSIKELELQSQHQEETHIHHWNHVDGQLNELKRLNQQQQDFENRMFECVQQLSKQIHHQLELQKEVTEKMSEQEEFQGSVLSRLDTQEALIDKLSRQVNHIRSILFERTNYLATKIEEGYKLTSSYVYKLMTGSEQPLTFFLLNNKKEENEKSSQL